ncbi:MAG: hypothetical protein AAGG48_30570 [Planctomycetota bacterium]
MRERLRALGLGHRRAELALMRLAVLQCNKPVGLSYYRVDGGTEFGTESIAKVQNSAKKLEIERAESLDE